MSIQFNISKEPIYDHCFSQDRKTLAITKENIVEIYDVSLAGKPRLLTTLNHHDKTITAVDISIHGKIVTCSQDRNALVWEPLKDGSYKPTLVLLRINRAATCVRWSPNGLKFAVGSAARTIAICYFEEENDWWISKHIKKPLKSTILSVDWHENNVLIACGSTDGHARVFSSYIKSVDSKPSPSIWGERLPFQTLCGDFMFNGSWVHDVKFSKNGDFIACVTHDSCLNIVTPSGNPATPEIATSKQRVKTSFLPFKALLFADDSKIVCAGHDCYSVVFEGNQQGWKQTYAIDDPNTKKQNVDESQQSALNLFRQLDLKGGNDKSKNSGTLATIHQNTINVLRSFQEDSQGVLRFSTCGNDGKVVIFDV
ncbi:hypothetical protein BVG19_g1550 [[Candida] boidinii]|nr:hypothetical protein BVG19_g1550 [[Candida] boidinii]OWB50298.1 hypothetical protein B5S27_g1846 [[Candida] boidinii]